MSYQGKMRPNNTAAGEAGSPDAPPASGLHHHPVAPYRIWPMEPLPRNFMVVTDELTPEGSIWLMPFYLPGPLKPTYATLDVTVAGASGDTLLCGVYDADGYKIFEYTGFILSSTGTQTLTRLDEELPAGMYWMAYYFKGAVPSTAQCMCWPETPTGHKGYGYVTHPGGNDKTVLPDYVDPLAITLGVVEYPLVILSEWT